MMRTAAHAILLVTALVSTSCLALRDAPKECLTSQDCDPGDFCGAGNECDGFCTDNADCLAGDYCWDSRCQSTPECRADSDCELSVDRCIDGVCECCF